VVAVQLGGTYMAFLLHAFRIFYRVRRVLSVCRASSPHFVLLCKFEINRLSTRTVTVDPIDNFKVQLVSG
jgi:hypothetical protein